MNASDLQTKLIEAARQEPPQDHVPYAFEKRIMAHLAGLSPLNYWALWGRPLWRAALSCVAVTLLCVVWSVAATTPKGAAASKSDLSAKPDSPDNFAQAFDRALFAAADQQPEDVW
jgi:hypothetical protein